MRRNYGFAGVGVLAAVLGCALAACLPAGRAQAGAYYVKIGGADGNGGGSWADAYATIGKALATASNDAVVSGDVDATVYVGKTTESESYAGASQNFTTNITLRLLGGYDPETGNPTTTKSRIRPTGHGLNFALPTTPPAGMFYTGAFVVANMDIVCTNAAGNGISCPVGTPYCNSNRFHNLIVSNCTVASVSGNGVRMTVSPDEGSGRRIASTHTLQIVSCTVTSASGPAVRIFGGTELAGPVFITNSLLVASSTLGTVFLPWEDLHLVDSVVTNYAAGWAVYAGESYWRGCPCSFLIRACTIWSAGSAVYWDARQLSPNNESSVIQDSTIIATHTDGTALYTPTNAYTMYNDTADAGIPEILITNSTLRATGAQGFGVYIGQTRNDSGDGSSVHDIVVADSSIHGGFTAFYHGGYETTWGRQDSEYTFMRSTFSAGALDGGANATGVVVHIRGRRSDTLIMDRCVVKNGAGGILYNGLGLQAAKAYLVNTVITDQTNTTDQIGYGLKIDPTSSGNSVTLKATNCTLSNLQGPAMVFGGTGTLAASLAYNVFAPGAAGGNGSATNFVNEDTDDSLVLSGTNNAFYAYGTYTNGLVTDNLKGTIDSPSGDPGLLSADGYHLLSTSPLKDKYTLRAGDPTVDIDGDTRPIRTMADIGADEATAPAGTIIQVH